MIVVDSSVWIDLLRKQGRRWIGLLEVFADPGIVVVGDIVLLEVLRGARDDQQAVRLERDLRQFRIEAMFGPDAAVQAARHYRFLRAAGVTVSKLPDLLIATYCVANQYALLHQDRDFDVLAPIMGLRVLRPDPHAFS